ncbi:MAG: peptide-methionine (S)-S-oxide reductase MsrA [Acidobacteriaceae bacterium]|nr:peptide-methionine (S)-S-oxide reductase MsrA [Acidobacteriaceae bacterium]
MRIRSIVTAAAALMMGGVLAFAGPKASFPDPTVDIPANAQSGPQKVVLAGGCFWGVQAVFDHLKGVTKTVAGFAGGEKSTAHYETVSTGRTGHAESVEITYDPNVITYGQILKVYFSIAHDPTELNRQGPDSGTQYRSAIFYMNDEQKKVAEAYIQQLDNTDIYNRKIVTQVVPFNGFYAAEGYHQHYLQSHTDQPYIVYNDLPKLEALKKQYPQMCKR